MNKREPLKFSYLDPSEMRARAKSFSELMKQRRSVRDFSPVKIPADVLEACLNAAGRAPCGANQQAWHFAVVQSPEVKKKIRQAAEIEEAEFYGGRAPDDWLDALSHLGTDAQKPFLEIAPVLIAIFQKSKADDGGKTYYPKESVGLATGVLITALHQAGLATLTHTPSPMKFLNEVLERPASEKPFLLLVVGFPTPDCTVPVISKKDVSEISSWH